MLMVARLGMLARGRSGGRDVVFLSQWQSRAEKLGLMKGCSKKRVVLALEFAS